MALRESFVQKVVTGTTAFALQAEANESLVVKDIQIVSPNSNYASIYIGSSLVGYYRIGGTLGSHLSLPGGRSAHAHDWKTSATAAGDQTLFVGLKNAGGGEVASKMIGNLSASTTYPRVGELVSAPNTHRETLLGYLADLGLFRGYPIPSGMKMTITFTQQASTRIIATYEIWDPADKKPTDDNGPEGKSLIYVAYGNAGASINVTGDTTLAVSANPVQFPAFPFGDDVPSKTEMEVIGLLASDFAPKENTGTNDCTTVALKVIRDRTTLFDKDGVGLRMEATAGANTGAMDLVAEGLGVIGNYSDVDYRYPLIFAPPLKFLEGQEMILAWNTLKAGTGQAIAVDEHEVGVILRLKKL